MSVRKTTYAIFIFTLLALGAFLPPPHPARAGPIDWLGGNFREPPEKMNPKLSAPAAELIRRAYADVDPPRMLDFHVHLLGLGRQGTGAYINPRLMSWKNPLEHLKTRVYLSAASIRNLDDADGEYVRRLTDLIDALPVRGRFALLAFDRHHTPEGRPDEDKTHFFTPSEYVHDTASRRPDIFVAAASVHPYRPDALAELDKWAAQGVRLIKWLPNSMGIDPSAERLRPFYEAMKRHSMVLLTHTGEEQAVRAHEHQHLGNPLLLRLPLQVGVRVVMAHCASLGDDEDLDQPHRPRVSSFALFIRMMEEPAYEGLLYGEISALLQFNRLDGPLKGLLEKPALHARLVNGSDYPLPAVNYLVRTGQLKRLGYLQPEQAAALNEIYGYNPLLFDYVLKRTVRHPATGAGFAAEVFMVPPALRDLLGED